MCPPNWVQHQHFFIFYFFLPSSSSGGLWLDFDIGKGLTEGPLKNLIFF
jgi:hypothetical protein